MANLPSLDTPQNGALPTNGFVASGWLKAQIQYSCTNFSYSLSSTPADAGATGAMRPRTSSAPTMIFFISLPSIHPSRPDGQRPGEEWLDTLQFRTSRTHKWGAWQAGSDAPAAITWRARGALLGAGESRNCGQTGRYRTARVLRRQLAAPDAQRCRFVHHAH